METSSGPTTERRTQKLAQYQDFAQTDQPLLLCQVANLGNTSTTWSSSFR